MKECQQGASFFLFFIWKKLLIHKRPELHWSYELHSCEANQGFLSSNKPSLTHHARVGRWILHKKNFISLSLFFFFFLLVKCSFIREKRNYDQATNRNIELVGFYHWVGIAHISIIRLVGFYPINDPLLAIGSRSNNPNGPNYHDTFFPIPYNHCPDSFFMLSLQ